MRVIHVDLYAVEIALLEHAGRELRGVDADREYFDARVLEHPRIHPLEHARQDELLKARARLNPRPVEARRETREHETPEPRGISEGTGPDALNAIGADDLFHHVVVRAAVGQDGEDGRAFDLRGDHDARGIGLETRDARLGLVEEHVMPSRAVCIGEIPLFRSEFFLTCEVRKAILAQFGHPLVGGHNLLDRLRGVFLRSRPKTAECGGHAIKGNEGVAQCHVSDLSDRGRACGPQISFTAPCSI